MVGTGTRSLSMDVPTAAPAMDVVHYANSKAISGDTEIPIYEVRVVVVGVAVSRCEFESTRRDSGIFVQIHVT